MVASEAAVVFVVPVAGSYGEVEFTLLAVKFIVIPDIVSDNSCTCYCSGGRLGGSDISCRVRCCC